MIFSLILIVFLVLVGLTVVVEYRRTRALTLLSLLSAGNLLYNALTPALAHYAPSSVVFFEGYLLDSGVEIQEFGLVRVLVAAVIVQLACLGVALSGSQKRRLIRSDSIKNAALLKAAIRVGWIMMLAGAAGAMWLGLIYNGHLWGLYEIVYSERSPLALENSVPAFMLSLAVYGAAQLIVVYLLSDRTDRAVLILLAMTLHGLEMKSKFPVFWVLLVFLVVAIGRRKQVLRLFLPIGFTTMVLATMSVLRGAASISEVPQYIVTYWDLISTTAAAPWNNDLPGPAAISYYVINSDVDYTLAPITETVRLLVPKFIFGRSPLLAEVYAERMLGKQYMPGMGFGWSLLLDGFLLAGWLGIALVAFVTATLARYVQRLGTERAGRLREFFIVVCYSSAPTFLYAMRESEGGLLKQLLVVSVVVWLPTFYLYRKGLPRTLNLGARVLNTRA